MVITLSERMRDAILKVQKEAREQCAILDIYRAAQDVQNSLPEENVALEDIITAMLSSHTMGFEAFEFDMRGMIVEVVIREPEGASIAEAA